jgi:hypothetical protein
MDPHFSLEEIQAFRLALLALYSYALTYFIHKIPQTHTNGRMPGQCTVSFGKWSESEIADYIAFRCVVPETIPGDYHTAVKEWLKKNLNAWSEIESGLKPHSPQDPICSYFKRVILSHSFKKQLLREYKCQLNICRDAHIKAREEEDRILQAAEDAYAKTSEGAVLQASITALKSKFESHAVPPEEYCSKKQAYYRLIIMFKKKAQDFLVIAQDVSG